LKKKATSERLQKAKAKSAEISAKKRREKRKTIYKRAESYAAEYRAAEKQAVAARRQARRAGNFYREPDAKLVFVVRIRGINQVPPKTKKILRLLRLIQVNLFIIFVNCFFFFFLIFFVVGEQWSVCASERRFSEDVDSGRSLDYLRIPQLEDGAGVDLQAWIRKGEGTAYPHH
jgi:hypothetical protein